MGFLLFLLAFFDFFSHPAPKVHKTNNGVIITVSGQTPQWEIARIDRLAESLNFTGQPMVRFWRIVIPEQGEWDEDVQKYGINTESAFTILGQNVTYLNPYYLTWTGDDRVRHTLAHESGHLSCNCKSEDEAERIAHQVEKQR